ncbi:methyltransferase domain-containing protein [Tundrisphaera sp. TA3]|uniref:methyltransferase domain-containing protein n=1 Tax=Tundrisphaera sp. TA3 TaxID=3435775 RepID=UPI003EB6FA31
MTTASSSDSNAQAYDNKGQYSRTSILRYEKIFGEGYISTGGHETTEYLCTKIKDALRPGARLLDVGSGIGGSMFFLAKTYGIEATGVDLAHEMIAIAHDRAQQIQAPDTVKSILGDVLTMDLEPASFDIVWSRDALMHIPDKAKLFSRLHSLNKPGGRLVITDYAKGVGERSPEFNEYIEKTGYHVVDPASYGKFLEGAGYKDVVVEDATDRFVAILERELHLLENNRADFLASFSEEDLNYLVARWKMKVGFCQAGDMKWGIYTATK